MKDLGNAKDKPEKGRKELGVEFVNASDLSDEIVGTIAKIIAKLVKYFPEVIRKNNEITIRKRQHAPQEFFTVTNASWLGDALYMSALYYEGRLLTEVRDTKAPRLKCIFPEEEVKNGTPIEVIAIKKESEWQTSIYIYV